MSFTGKLRYQMERTKQRGHYMEELKKIEARKNGQIPEQFAAIHAMEKCCSGERCVIVADSIGLTESDISVLKQETTFGVSDFLQQDDWKATYAGIQDPNAFGRLGKKLTADYGRKLFVGDNLAGMLAQPELVTQFPYLGVYKYYLNQYGEYRTKFSDNAFEVVYDGYGIVYSMLQIAVYMGFTEIDLYGCLRSMDERKAAAYRVAKQYAEEHGIRIYDCTAGQSSDIFPHRSLQDIAK